MPGNGGSVASNTDMEKPILNSKFGRRTLHLMVSTLLKGLAACVLLVLPEGNGWCASHWAGSRSGSPLLSQGTEPSVADSRMDARVFFAKGEAALKRGDLVGADAAFRKVSCKQPKSSNPRCLAFA